MTQTLDNWLGPDQAAPENLFTVLQTNAGYRKDPAKLAKRQANALFKASRRMRYGKSLTGILKAAERTLDPGARAAYLGSQFRNRVQDDYTGRGRYRRRKVRRVGIKRRRVRGRGAYDWKPLRRGIAKAGRFADRYRKPIGYGLGAIASTYLGPEAGSQAMAFADGLGDVGKAVGGRGIYMGGRGSYNVEGNSLIEGLGNALPSFESVGEEDGSMILTHSEFISDVYGQEYGGNGKALQAMDSTVYELNPGLARTFPFLSQTANDFEEYEMIQCMFIYKSKLAENLSSSDGQMGSILMYTEYNPNDPMMTSKQKILQNYANTNAKVTDMALHGVECDPAKIHGDGHKYTRSNPITSTTDKIAYDMGKTMIAVSGTPAILANQVLGELWVSYRIVLRKPRVHSLYGLTLNKDTYTFNDPSHGTALVEGTALAEDPFNNINTLVEAMYDTTPGLVRMTFPASFAGDVKIQIHLTQGSTVVQPANPSVVGHPGNVYLPQASGNITALDANPFVGNAHGDLSWAQWNTPTVDEQWSGTIWLSVEQASSGTDNWIQVQVPFTAGAPPITARQGWVTVERFNGFERKEMPEVLKLGL